MSSGIGAITLNTISKRNPANMGKFANEAN